MRFLLKIYGECVVCVSVSYTLCVSVCVCVCSEWFELNLLKLMNRFSLSFIHILFLYRRYEEN